MTFVHTSPRPLRTLIVGANYGLLPASKIACSGHAVTTIGRAKEVVKLKSEEVSIHFSKQNILRPPLGDDGLSFATPTAVDPTDFDLVLLAVQEPQVQSPDIQNLLMRIGDQVPIASIMNMPPPPFLDRIKALPKSIREDAFCNPLAWQSTPPQRFTLASPDPQVFKPDEDHPGQLTVTLASNFKFAPFHHKADQKILERICRDASRKQTSWGRTPVHMLARGSVFAPLSKWPMLVTGNCRCWNGTHQPLSIHDAVHCDLAESQILYDAVNSCLFAFGMPEAGLVSFNSYLRAVRSLTRPSSLARGLANGATNVERIDLLVLNLMKKTECDLQALEIMSKVSANLEMALKKNADLPTPSI